MNIGRYEIIKELGQGGMALVYLARDPLIKRQVAVKVLPRQFTFDPKFRARFQHEVEVIATLEHAAIVPVYDFGEFEDQPFIVMRYISGGSLADRLGHGPLPIPEIAALFQRIGSAIDYAHRLGVVHRDIKPGNILFDAQGEASLSDFGIAKLTESTAAFTGTGGMIGTPTYMSPEQALGGKNVDGRSDIYSLGVVLFEALSGQPPFNGDTPMGVAVAHINQPVPSLLERQPDLPPRFEAVIRKALDKDPAKRFQTASELAKAINDTGMRPIDGTIVEQPAGTLNKPVHGTILEAYSPPPTPPPPVSVQSAYPSSMPSQPIAKKSAMPKILGFGGIGVLALCLCVGVIGSYASGLIPNPFASPTEIANTVASETPALSSDATETALPTSEPTIAPTDEIAIPSEPTTEVAFEGDAGASSTFDPAFPPSLVIDGDLTTSWLSAGPDGDGTSTFVWTGIQEDLVYSIELISNRENQESEFRTNYGFGEVTIQLFNAADDMVFEETVNLDGTPDPDVIVYPNVVGQWVWLILRGSEASNSSGFAELRVNVVR
ncbi:MAG: serine/threonine protein kinase [Anaerolineales bacterium]|nr:serine/threonine protein kinase [Anaerolineales bacterium]